MELSEFITTTLNEIIEGVDKAKEKYKQLGGGINPPNIQMYDQCIGKIVGYPSTKVEFEVALSETNSDSKHKGIGVALSFVSAGGDKNFENELKSLTKVKFNVIVQLPTSYKK